MAGSNAPGTFLVLLVPLAPSSPGAPLAALSPSPLLMHLSGSVTVTPCTDIAYPRFCSQFLFSPPMPPLPPTKIKIKSCTVKFIHVLWCSRQVELINQNGDFQHSFLYIYTLIKRRELKLFKTKLQPKKGSTEKQTALR